MPPTIDRRGQNSYGNVTSATYGTIPEPLITREVPDFIPTVGREDTPLASLIPKGGSRNLTKWEFGEGDLRSTNDKLAANHNNTTDTAIVVANAKKFQKWNLIRNARTGEIMLVTDVTDSTNTLTVVREWGKGATGGAPDTSPAKAAGQTNDAIQIIAPAIPEGAVSPLSPIQQGELFVTYPQIFEYTWQFTHRGKLTPTYEVKSDRFKHELKKKLKEAAKDLDRAMLHGIATPGDGNAAGNVPSTMGGLRQYTNVYSKDVSAAPLTFIVLMEEMEKLFKDVGRQNMGKTIMGSMFTKRVFNSFFQGSRQSTQRDSKTNMVWDEVETDFGTIKFVTHYDMPDNELFIWNPEDCKLITYEGGNWETGMYETQGWFYKGFLRGDMGVLFEAARRRTRIFNYSTTRSDYPNLDLAWASAPINVTVTNPA